MSAFKKIQTHITQILHAIQICMTEVQHTKKIKKGTKYVCYIDGWGLFFTIYGTYVLNLTLSSEDLGVESETIEIVIFNTCYMIEA